MHPQTIPGLVNMDAASPRAVFGAANLPIMLGLPALPGLVSRCRSECQR
jgi:hypothetical protein